MKINNPKVTLSDEARIGVEEEVRSGFLDWLGECNVEGDDGQLYMLGGSIISMNLEQIDLVTICMAEGKGKTRQLKDSIYRVAEYLGASFNRFHKYPKGTLKMEMKDHSVLVSCGKEYSVECFDDNSWHVHQDTCDGMYIADYWHRPYGYPLWYGRETPSYLTQHSVTYGYNWAGDVEGYFVKNGKRVNFRGSGQRERYVAVDSSAAELGGWEDWGYITFNEMHSSMYDMRLGMKDFSLYDIETGKHYPEGEMTIEHENWAFMRELDGFVPEIYNIRIEVEDGVFEVRAHTCNARVWGVTFKVPDYPVATLAFDNVEGTFTSKDGKVRVLTGGRGTMSVRQWHEYPRILPRELYCEQETPQGEKFQTL